MRLPVNWHCCASRLREIALTVFCHTFSALAASPGLILPRYCKLFGLTALIHVLRFRRGRVYHHREFVYSIRASIWTKHTLDDGGLFHYSGSTGRIMLVKCMFFPPACHTMGARMLPNVLSSFVL